MSGPGPVIGDEAWSRALVEHVNEHHPDAIDVLVRAHGAGLGLHLWGDDARVVGVDGHGLVLAAGPWQERVCFRHAACDERELARGFADLVGEARRWLGDDRPTSIERELAARLWFATVAHVERPTPRTARITLSGDDLRAMPAAGPAASVYVLLPPVGRSELTVDATFTWERWDSIPDADRPVGAHYTVRAHRPADGELDLVVVLHGAGPASRWAATAAPGAPVALWGPRPTFRPPPCTGTVVVVVDDSGVPAAAAIAGAAEAWLGVQVIAQVVGPSERVAIDAPAVWVEAGPDALAEAFAAATVPPDAFVWGAAERRVASALRRCARERHGLRREQVHVEAYWTR